MQLSDVQHLIDKEIKLLEDEICHYQQRGGQGDGKCCTCAHYQYTGKREDYGYICLTESPWFYHYFGGAGERPEACPDYVKNIEMLQRLEKQRSSLITAQKEIASGEEISDKSTKMHILHMVLEKKLGFFQSLLWLPCPELREIQNAASKIDTHMQMKKEEQSA